MKIIFTFFLLISVSICFSQPPSPMYTWKGSVNSDWNTAMNWESNQIPTNQVPGGGSVVIIEGGHTNYPILDGNFDCLVMVIEAGAYLTLAPTAKLLVGIELTNLAGTGGLILQADANNYATLIHTYANVEATVEVYVPGTAKSKYFVCPPGITHSSSIVQSNPAYIYEYDETQIDSWGAVPTTVTGWTAVTGSLVSDKGYVCLKNTDKLTFTGTLVDCSNSDYVITASYTSTSEGITFDGWNLLGNSLTANIDWENITLTNIDATYYIYNPETDNYSYYTQGGANLNATQYIKPGQGFFVKANGTSPNITIGETGKVLKSGKELTSDGEKQDMLKLKVNANNSFDEIIVQFNDDASTEFDGKYDAYKLFTDEKTVPQIYTKQGDINYAINTKAISSDSEKFDLYLDCASGKDYSIMLTENEIVNFPFVYLEDKITAKLVELKKDVAYTFNYTKDESNKTRFSVRFEKSALSVNDIPKSKIEIYPNPAQNIIYVIGMGNMAYSISDLSGKQLKSGTISGNSLDISELAIGVYFININSGETKTTIKIVRN